MSRPRRNGQGKRKLSGAPLESGKEWGGDDGYFTNDGWINKLLKDVCELGSKLFHAGGSDYIFFPLRHIIEKLEDIFREHRAAYGTGAKLEDSLIVKELIKIVPYPRLYSTYRDLINESFHNAVDDSEKQISYLYSVVYILDEWRKNADRPNGSSGFGFFEIEKDLKTFKDGVLSKATLQEHAEKLKEKFKDLERKFRD